jgi:hypothetical protein
VDASSIQANLRWELLGETGIDIDELDTEPGWTVVLDGAVVAVMKKLTRTRMRASFVRESRNISPQKPSLNCLTVAPYGRCLTSTLGCRVFCTRFSEIFGAREFFAFIGAVE